VQSFSSALQNRSRLLQLAHLRFRLLVDQDVEACVRRIADGRRAEASEEAAGAFLREDVLCCAGQGGVGVVGALVAHFEHRDGVHDEAGCHARRSARSQIGDVAQLRQRGGSVAGACADASASGVGEACCDGEAGQASGVGAHAVQHAEVEGAAEAGADHGGGGAAPELADWVGAIEDLAQGVGDGGGAGAGLLDAGFEQVGGLEEEGGRAA